MLQSRSIIFDAYSDYHEDGSRESVATIHPCVKNKETTKIHARISIESFKSTTMYGTTFEDIKFDITSQRK